MFFSQHLSWAQDLLVSSFNLQSSFCHCCICYKHLVVRSEIRNKLRPYFIFEKKMFHQFLHVHPKWSRFLYPGAVPLHDLHIQLSEFDSASVVSCQLLGSDLCSKECQWLLLIHFFTSTFSLFQELWARCWKYYWRTTRLNHLFN